MTTKTKLTNEHYAKINERRDFTNDEVRKILKAWSTFTDGIVLSNVYTGGSVIVDYEPDTFIHLVKDFVDKAAQFSIKKRTSVPLSLHEIYDILTQAKQIDLTKNESKETPMQVSKTIKELRGDTVNAMIGRMKSDILYYNRHPHVKFLWSGSVEQHIEDFTYLVLTYPKIAALHGIDEEVLADLVELLYHPVDEVTENKSLAESKKPKLSESDKTILGQLQSHGYNNLVRNSKGVLYAYSTKPSKVNGEWTAYRDMPYMVEQQYAFNFVKHSNRNAWNITDLLLDETTQVSDIGRVVTPARLTKKIKRKEA